MERDVETIVALSTPPGRAAIAVVRLSGPDAVRLADAQFDGRQRLADLEGGRTAVGVLRDTDDRAIDEVLVALFRAPHSYTGEDVVEVSCHGNPVLAETLIDGFVAAGARPAEPGEFTRRAFLNGRIDLAQAEAVGAVIAAQGRAAARGALRQLRGEFSTRVAGLRDQTVGVMARLEAVVDFPDQDVAQPDHAGLRECLDGLGVDVRSLAEAVRRGRPLAQRASAVLVGAPNVGKSSIFNVLLGHDRAIVHPEPGTTRDVVDADVDLDGVTIRLVDTAGIRDARDDVERQGVSRSRDEGARADVVLFVVDATMPLTPAEQDALATWPIEGRIVVANKTDLPHTPSGTPADALPVSAATGAGMEALRRAIRSSILGAFDSSESWVTSLRQEGLVLDALAAVDAARGLVTETPEASELIVEELRRAARAFDQITGDRVGPDVLDTIFAEFCIGK